MHSKQVVAAFEDSRSGSLKELPLPKCVDVWGFSPPELDLPDDQVKSSTCCCIRAAAISAVFLELSRVDFPIEIITVQTFVCIYCVVQIAGRVAR